MTEKFSGNKDNSKSDLRRLKEVLDIYGSVSELWPETDRIRLLKIVSQSRQAHTLFREAEVLDQLIQAAREIRIPDDLNHRILASVLNAERSIKEVDGAHLDNVVPLSAYRHESLPIGRWKKLFPAAALMAASLLIGIYIGYSDLTHMSPLSDTKTEVAALDFGEQNELSTLLALQSMEESLSLSEDPL